MAPAADAIRMAAAIARSIADPSLRSSAGARLTVIRPSGHPNPALWKARPMRSRLSRSVAPASPTMENPGNAAATSACNRIKHRQDISAVLERISALSGIQGVLIIKGDRVGLAGDLPELIRHNDPAFPGKITGDARSGARLCWTGGLACCIGIIDCICTADSRRRSSRSRRSMSSKPSA